MKNSIRSFLLFSMVLFTLQSFSQRSFIQPEIFSDTLSAFKATGGYATSTAVSDGYIVQAIVPQSSIPTGEYYENTILLIKLDQNGDFVSQYKVSDHFDSIMTAMPSIVTNDTLMFSAFDGKDWGQIYFGHPSFFRFDKDLNLIDFVTSRDTMFGPPVPSWQGIGSTVADNKIAYRWIFGGYRDNAQHGGSRGYGHTLDLNGKLRSVPIDANVPFTVGQAQVEDDRILLVGSQAFVVFDTAWSTVIDGKSFLDAEIYPAVNSGSIGFSPRGIMIDGACYFFLTAGCADVGRSCVAAQKWSKEGIFLEQEILWRADSGRGDDGGLYTHARNSKSYLYDNNKTIYSLHNYTGPDSVHWDLCAVDTNLNLKWRKTFSRGTDRSYVNDISFSIDSSMVLITGLEGPAGVSTANSIISYFVDTLSGEISSINPSSPTLKEEVFLIPTVASSTFEILSGFGKENEIASISMYSLGSGKSIFHKVEGKGHLDISTLTQGMYVAIAYNKDSAPIRKQRVIISR